MSETYFVQFDFNSALDNLGHDRELLKELAAIFVEDAPGLMEGAKSALQQSDWHNTCRRIHSLKGLSADFYAEPTRTVADALESALRSGETIHAPRDLAWFSAEMLHFERLVAQTCQQLIESLKLQPLA